MEFAAIAFASGINSAMPDDIIFITPNRPEHETVIFGTSGQAGSESFFTTIDVLALHLGQNFESGLRLYI